MSLPFKYIFMAGAPGSKWSSVSKNIYFSPDIDNSDYSEDRLYYHDATGKLELMHLGAYFDPGMEFGDFFEDLYLYSKEDCEKEFDRPFSGAGVRIIKSHVFADNIDFLKEKWPDCPILLCYRNDDECLGWWVKCGHFDITYPLYDKYYINLREMSKIIQMQNANLLSAAIKYRGTEVSTNALLCSMLGLALPPAEYKQNYLRSDVRVTLL